ncbi:MAG: methionyl-tRNA formyltransferase [Candidatus Adiutrix sp.]|jgi:methionyl-tRNA formyltransferase|nr:methionyl-tRNA formyltransferase [Candidatus Adiutrix sp.]
MPEVSPWRIIFFGSAEFSLPALKALSRGPDQVVLAVTPPPAPAGRGRKLRPSPVAGEAGRLGLAHLEAKSLKNPETLNKIRKARPDLLVVAAFGAFLPEELLTLGPHPPLNIHPSLLPRHRGAAPVNWSLIQGDSEVGVSIIFLEKEMDAGPILSQSSFPRQSSEGAAAWESRLAEAGARDLMKVIADLKQGTAVPRPQNQALATVNRLLRKEDGRVDFSRPAAELAGLINGVDPWPGAQSSFKGKNLKLFGASAVDDPDQTSPPGRVRGPGPNGQLLVATGRGLLSLSEIQPEGKKRMPAADFLRGYRPERLG